MSRRPRGLDVATVQELVADHTERPHVRLRSGEPRVNVLELNIAVLRAAQAERWDHRHHGGAAPGRAQARPAADLPRRGPRGRQDLAMLDEAQPSRRPRHRRRRRPRRDARARAHRGDDRGPRGGAAARIELPRRRVRPRWTSTPSLARRPAVALVDELAHTNVAGGRHEKRWQDVEELLDAGIDVISTVNIQHLESLNDVVEPITGVRSGRRCPTRWCARPTRSSSSTCRPRRCAAGWRTATSTAPRRSTPRSPTTSGSATSRRCASSPCCGSPTGSTRRSSATGPTTASQRPWPTRERVVVALTGGAGSETLLRRGARIATRAAGGDLLAVPRPVGRRSGLDRPRRARAPAPSGA